MSKRVAVTCKVEIQVTQKHIDEGELQSCEECPIALAINAALKPAFTVSVWNDSAKILDELGDRARFGSRTYPEIHLPSPVPAFIADVDRKRAVQPFMFSLRLPVVALRAPKGE